MSTSCTEDNGCKSSIIRENMIGMSMTIGKGRHLETK